MSFAELQPGWLEGFGKALPVEGLEWLADQWGKYGSGIPRPMLFPTEDGRVQAEWRIGTEDVSLEIDLQTHAVLWHRLDTASGLEVEIPGYLDTEAAWDGLKRHFSLISPELRSQWPFKETRQTQQKGAMA